MSADHTTTHRPLVSIGMPVYNGAPTVAAAIESIIRQTFLDIELVISDNCSTDNTPDICKKYARNDSRIRYIRQDENIGASANFKYVAHQARGKYFAWAAADDVRSLDFIEINVRFLEENPQYIASTSPNCLEVKKVAESWVNFEISGEFEERVMIFLDNCWESNGIFYSVMRTRDIIECDQLGEHFLASDWAIDMHLIKKGNIKRTSGGHLVLGRDGVSNSVNRWRVFRTSILSWPLPFYRFSLYVWRLTSGCSWRWRMRLALRLIALNRDAAYHQLYAELFPYYLKFIRPWIKGV